LLSMANKLHPESLSCCQTVRCYSVSVRALSRSLFSQVGAKMLEAAVFGAYFNVMINLKDITDEKFKTEVSRSCMCVPPLVVGTRPGPLGLRLEGLGGLWA